MELLVKWHGHSLTKEQKLILEDLKETYHPMDMNRLSIIAGFFVELNMLKREYTTTIQTLHFERGLPQKALVDQLNLNFGILRERTEDLHNDNQRILEKLSLEEEKA
jgi:hypothetical protein